MNRGATEGEAPEATRARIDGWSCDVVRGDVVDKADGCDAALREKRRGGVGFGGGDGGGRRTEVQ